MPNYDDNITLVPKTTGSYTEVSKPAVSYTVVSKGVSPASTKIPKPYTEPLAILAEDGVEILLESSVIMTVQGAL